MLARVGLLEIAVLLGLALPALTVADLARRANQPASKLFWLIAIVFLPVLGPVLYLVIGRDQLDRELQRY